MNPIHRRATAALVAWALVSLVLPTASAVTIDWVTVGDAGNAADGSGYGDVAQEFRIGQYEVTIGQYAEFLNAVAADDTYSLYNGSMASTANIAGITQSGTSGSFTYAVTGPNGSTPPGASSPGNRPITFVSWFDAARFANWIANGQPTGAQDNTTTEDGAYFVDGVTSGNSVAKNATNPNTGSAPTAYIPTENEWYKAAYYKAGGTNAGYWTYATQSDSVPGNVIGSGANQANYYDSANDEYSVTQAAYSATQNYLTDAGAFTNSESAYNTFDQSGNVFEWNDLDGTVDSVRGIRGGSWGTDDLTVASSFRGTDLTSSESDVFGFRLASPVPVPEPSTLMLGAIGLTFAGWNAIRLRRTR